MDWILFAFALIVCVSYGVQTITGFGSMLLCLTLGAQLMPIDRVLNLAVPISLLQTGYIVSRYFRHVDWRLLLLRIVPAMGLGMVLGFWITARAPDASLKRVLGALVLILAVKEFWQRLRRAQISARPLPEPVVVAVMAAAGVVHGVFATGGPLLVYVTSRLNLNKHTFRATLTAVWLTLNSALLVRFVSAGRIDRQVLESLPWLAPAVPLGIFLGEKLHARIDERRFQLAVYGLLVVAALVLLLR